MTAHHARERLEAALSRITDPLGEGARAFTRVYAEEARAAAEAADARARHGVSLGPLDGRVVSVKDLFDVRGEPTTGGSLVYAGARAAAADAPVVARLRRAGAVIIGKTNMTEFAFSGIGINLHHGTPGNPADRTRIPGGSSSGAAVSCADAMCEISIGSDTGGSVRIPAAFCGLVGFKPTQRRVPREGAMPLSLTLDSVGPLARSVADAHAADAVLSGGAHRPLDPPAVAHLRLAVPQGRLFEALEKPVVQAFERALARLAKAGARIVDIDMEPHLKRLDAVNALGSIAAVEAAWYHAVALRTRAGEIDPFVVRRILNGSKVAAPDYVRMLQDRAAAAKAANAEFARYDALILPTVPITAPKTAPLAASIDAFTAANMLILRNTTQFNLLDCCAVSLPLPGAGALPVGLMLAAARGRDARLFDVAAAAEGFLKAA